MDAEYRDALKDSDDLFRRCANFERLANVATNAWRVEMRARRVHRDGDKLPSLSVEHARQARAKAHGEKAFKPVGVGGGDRVPGLIEFALSAQRVDRLSAGHEENASRASRYVFVLLGHLLALLGLPMTQLIRSASLTGFTDLCVTLGLDPKRLAAAAGVPWPALSNPDLKVESGSVAKLLELAADKSGVEAFGLRLAETRLLSNLGPVGLIARDQPSLRRALAVMRQYLWLHNEALSLSLDEVEDIAVLGIDMETPGAITTRQAIELSVGVLCTNLRALLGPRWRPEAAAFRHGPPRDVAVHKRVFGKTPQFLVDFNGIVLTRSDLETPLAAADPAMARQIERYVEGLARERPSTARETVGEVIVLLLPTNTCSAERVATHLGVDRRTLHRRLAAEGLNFRALLYEQRARLALALLDQTKNCTSVAELTGFSSLSTFSHWFRRRFGTSPRSHIQAAIYRHR